MLNLTAIVGSRGLRSLYWSRTHSRAERLPRQQSQTVSGTPVSVVAASRQDGAALHVGPQRRLAWQIGLFHALQRVRVGGVEVDVEVLELLANTLPGVEVVVDGQAGELAEQVNGVLLNVHTP